LPEIEKELAKISQQVLPMWSASTSVFLYKPWEAHYHSMLDIPEYVDPNTLKVVGEISGLAAWRLANR